VKTYEVAWEPEMHGGWLDLPEYPDGWSMTALEYEQGGDGTPRLELTMSRGDDRIVFWKAGGDYYDDNEAPTRAGQRVQLKNYEAERLADYAHDLLTALNVEFEGMCVDLLVAARQDLIAGYGHEPVTVQADGQSEREKGWEF
jgi:hypothetical protein